MQSKEQLKVVVYPLYSFLYLDLLKEVEEAELGIQLNSGNRISGLLFADDFVGVSD